MADPKKLWWWDRMTPEEQRKYVHDHPHTHMVPNSSNATEALVNPDRARATALVKKIQDARKHLSENGDKHRGLPAGSNDLVKHLSRSSDPAAPDLLSKLESSWNSVSTELKGKASNPEVFKAWSARLNKDHGADLNKMKESLKKDPSFTAAHAISSIDNILNAHKTATRQHSTQIALEFLKVSQQI